jgi:hypothetical protein
MAYDSFWQAYQAQHPDSPYTPAGQTWTPGNLQNLTDAWGAAGNAPTPQMIAGGYASPPPVFDPYGDPAYAATASQNLKTVGHAQDYHDYRQGSGEQNFGYDAQGNLITGGANYDPYSQAMVLQRNYDNTKRGTVNNYAAQGQLYSGALLNKQSSDAYNYNVADDQLKRGASDYYHANDYSLTQTKDSADAILAQLLGPTFTNFLNSQKG